MSQLNRGDIILVPFPFTDLKSHKVRPAVILSPKISIRGDVIVGFISSVVPLAPVATEIVLQSGNRAFRASGLKVNSVFRMDKVTTLHRSLVLRQLGHVPASFQAKLNRALARAVGLRK